MKLEVDILGMNAYKESNEAESYQGFLASENGQMFQKILAESYLKRLETSGALKILDAGCGQGWLAHKLFLAGHKVWACDASEALLNEAREIYPEVNFQVADITQGLPFAQAQFDLIVLNMVAHDLENPAEAFKNLYAILKPNGRLIAAIVNPYYGYPIGVWKRGLTGFLLRKKPLLKLAQGYNLLSAKQNKNYVWNRALRSRFYTLAEHLNNFAKAGFALSYFEDLSQTEDSKKFNLQYQLHRFPIILLMEFTKH